jgi:hypothetical protein
MTPAHVFPSVDWTATFENDCIAAIEAYIRAAHLHAPQTMIYRGLALDSIVARHLYVLLISDRDVQLHYATAMAGEVCTLPLADPHVRAIVAQLTGREIPAGGGAVRVPLMDFFPAWKFVRWLRHGRKRHAAMGGRGRPLLLMAHHPKFVRYFRPLLGAMPDTGAFLLSGRQMQDALGIADAEAIPMPLATPQTKTPAVLEWRTLCVMVDEIETALRQYAPRCVLVAEGDAPYHEALALVGRKLRIPVLCLQWGAYPYRAPHLGFRGMSHKAFLAWGEGFAEQLRPYNRDLRFIAVGNHVLDEARETPRRRILFLMQGADNYTIQPEHWDRFMDFTVWTARENPGWEIVIRPHPSLPLSAAEQARLAAFANVTFQDTIQTPMGAALAGAAIAVTIVSSAILEALAQGVFPFLFNPTTMVPRFQPDLEALGAGIEAKTLERAKSEMARLLADPALLETYASALTSVRRHFFAATGSTALNNIVSTIRTAMAGGL